MVKGCGLKTDVTDHSGGQASCQKKAECEVCGQEYGELEAHNYGSEWKHDETSHWRECQTEGCTAKTDVTKHSGESVRQKDVQRKQMWLNTVEVRQLIRKKPSVLYVKLAMVK